MAQQSLIWTALPNGYTPDGNSLCLSILLSPRLDPQSEPQLLQTFFPDWKDWPKRLRNARFDITFNGQTVSVRGDDTTGPNRVDNRLGLAESGVWQALFKHDLSVRSFMYKDLSKNAVLSYDTMAMAEMIENLYRDLARTTGDNMPLVSDIVEDRNWSMLVSQVLELDGSSVDRETGLRNPLIQFDTVLSDDGHGGQYRMLERFQLFHTPPATPKPRHEARQDDARIDARWLEYQRQKMPAKEDLAKQLDFHQIIAAMGSYPTLLRKLGLVVDLLLDPDSFSAAANAALSVKVTFAPGTLQIPRTGDAGPDTRALLNSTQFQTVSDQNAELRIKDGLLDIDPSRFSLLQVDVDSAGLKVMNFARSLGRRGDVEERVDSITRHEEEIGAPSLRTGGLMLVHHNRRVFLKKRFDRNKSGNSNIESQFLGASNSVSLHAEDLVRGYRIDIWDSTTTKWRSLCRRTARYELDDGATIIEAKPEEESTIRLAATKSSDSTSNPNLLYLHEALVSWTGWSLAAPPPGRVIKPDDSVDKTRTESETEVPPGLKFKSSFKAVPRSLPRLRFGRFYWIRARAVDLAGNSLAPQEEDFGSEQPNEQARPYLRYEPVAAPVIALLSHGGTIEKSAEGESIARIAIRSFNDTPEGNTVPSSQVAYRVAVPPRASVRDAEQHGKLDSLGKVDSTTFNQLANQKDIDPRDAAAAIREVKIPMKGSLESEPVLTTFAVYEASRTLTYLPDPLAQEVAARIFDHPNITDTEIITIPLYPTGEWPDAQPFTIEVYDNSAEKPYFDTVSRRLRVPLPKAIRAKIRLSMKLAPEGLEKMGIFAWLSDADKDTQRDRAQDGQHWMLTPWSVVEVVHAVQRPLIAPEIQSLSVAPRAIGATSARPIIISSCSIASTDRLDLLAEWHEPLDNADVPESATGPSDRLRRDVAFPVKITDARTYATRLNGSKAGGFPDHTINGQDLIGLNTLAHNLLPVKMHEFHDTRYRRIEYWFDATTRFREFLPDTLLVEGEERIPIETHIKVSGSRAVTWIPNSAPPPAPKVLYVVPTFGWTRTKDSHGNLSSWRRGGGLRIYLDRLWNASGYGEMLGVVLPPADFSGDPDSQPTAYPYKKYVTQWGNDPAWDSPFVSGIAPHRSNFPLARIAPDASGAWLPPGAPETEKDQKPGPFTVTGLHPPTVLSDDSVIDVAPHDVFYDNGRKLWYCDIEIEAGSSYFPFVRLALARYQPISSPSAHLSNIVLTDIMALTVDRWLNVMPTADARSHHIAVFGVSYRESSAHQEAKRAPSMSLFNPLTGQVEELMPANIAESSIIEVWVERLDPRMGADFGWQRVENAVVTPLRQTEFESIPISSSPIHFTLSRPISDAERLNARELLATRDFERLAQDRLVDTVRAWQALWEGDVTLPTSPNEEVRYRLIIAEYEEYLTDDDRPYDKVPTQKDRRLVFVEHVELT
jgi:hypothetical protein